jgi:hypothetical protein
VKVLHVVLADHDQGRCFDARKGIEIVLEWVEPFRRTVDVRLVLEGASLHPREALAQVAGGVGEQPGLHDGVDGRLDVAVLESGLLGLYHGFERGRLGDSRSRTRDQHERGDALGCEHGHALRHGTAERVADECHTLDTDRIDARKNVVPRCIFVRIHGRLAEPGKVKRENSQAGVRQWL